MALVVGVFFFNFALLVQHHVKQVILACLAGGMPAFPLPDLLVDDGIHPLHQPRHPAAHTLEVGRS